MRTKSQYLVSVAVTWNHTLTCAKHHPKQPAPITLPPSACRAPELDIRVRIERTCIFWIYGHTSQSRLSINGGLPSDSRLDKTSALPAQHHLPQRSRTRQPPSILHRRPAARSHNAHLAMHVHPRARFHHSRFRRQAATEDRCRFQCKFPSP
jgi:hypothetical protein